MKKISFLLLFLFFLNMSAQDLEKGKAKQTVLDFFEAFHAQDSIKMKGLVTLDVILQTIGKNREGETRIKTENFKDLITSIVSIPDSIPFKEKLLSFEIKIDGAMANVWVPYEFWFQNKFHHCGVNSFQLYKEEEQWKIIYLIDTRRVKGCRE